MLNHVAFHLGVRLPARLWWRSEHETGGRIPCIVVLWIVLPIPVAFGFAWLSEQLAGGSPSYAVVTTLALAPGLLVATYGFHGLLVSWWVRRTGGDVGSVVGEEWRRRELRWWDCSL